MIEASLGFSLAGIVVSITSPLARAGISIFALSAFDTDHILVKDAASVEANRLLAESGHSVA